MTRFTMFATPNKDEDATTEIFRTTGLTSNVIEAVKFAIAETVISFSDFGDNGNTIIISDAARLRRIWDRVSSIPKRGDDKMIRESASTLLSEVGDIHAACLVRKNSGYKMPEEMWSFAAGYLHPVFEFVRNELKEEKN